MSRPVAFKMMPWGPTNEKYLPTPELQQILHGLFSLSPEEYLKARYYLGPFGWMDSVFGMLSNIPCLGLLFNKFVMEEYWQYHAQFAMDIGAGASSTPVPVDPKKVN